MVLLFFGIHLSLAIVRGWIGVYLLKKGISLGVVVGGGQRWRVIAIFDGGLLRNS